MMLSIESSVPSAANSDKDGSEQLESEMPVENGTDNKNIDDDNEAEPEMSMSDEEADDPLACIKNVIKWKGEVGYLPGSVCRFKVDADGDLLLADEDFEEEPFRKRQKLMTANIASDDYLTQEISRCKNCNSYAFKEEFLKNGSYCKQCAHLNPMYFKMFKNLSLLYDNKNGNHLIPSVIAPVLQSVPVVTSHHSGKSFSWDIYLEKNNAVSIPNKLFLPSQLCPSKENQFEVGMKLEGVDPFHPSRYCVLTVTEIIGHRLRLHFDGYKRKYDYWVNSNNEFIFPAGFCRNSHRKLEPPKGISRDSFNWESYLKQTNSVAAPHSLFTVPQECPTKLAAVVQAGFNVGMKLEAVDKANNNLICVASIKDILNEYLLIHFDGWDDSYDYWAHINSPLIHPINWCKSKGKPLTAPKDYRSDNFFWEEYLNETDTVSVPSRSFRPKPANSWKTGMKLEAMDARNPRLIRVATVVSRSSHIIKIHFDGWDDKYDYWIDDDCPNLHPIKWCAQTKHPLQPPPNNNKNSKKSKVTCTISQCTGQGHVRWYNHKRHHKVEDCPYNEHNLDSEPTDRYESSNENDESDEEVNDDEVEDEEEEEFEDEEVINESELNYEQKNTIEINHFDDIYHSSNGDDSFSNYSFAMIETEYNAPEMPPDLLQSCKKLLADGLLFDPSEVPPWDYGQVEDFVLRLTECQQTSRIFADQRIDGESFLMLTHDDLINQMKIKLGPAVKISSCIAAIRALLLVGQQQ